MFLLLTAFMGEKPESSKNSSLIDRNSPPLFIFGLLDEADADIGLAGFVVCVIKPLGHFAAEGSSIQAFAVRETFALGPGFVVFENQAGASGFVTSLLTGG